MNHGRYAFTIAGYFTSEAIMAVSEGNITTFFIHRQETDETQHIYISATLVFSHDGDYKLQNK